VTLKRGLILYGAVFLFAIPLSFPVRLLAGLITLPDGVVTAELKGSLWSVHLDWVQVGSLRVNDLIVRPSIVGLFSGAPLKLSLTDPLEVSAKVGSTSEGAIVRGLTARTRLDAVRDLLKIPPLGLDASIALAIDEAVIAGDHCQALTGELKLTDFEGNIEGLPQLKAITGELSCDTGRVILTVNPDNALRLSGTAVFSANGHYQVTMQAEPPLGPLFETFVDLLGQPRDGKRFQLNFRS
jgi:hypothetical protein